MKVKNVINFPAHFSPPKALNVMYLNASRRVNAPSDRAPNAYQSEYCIIMLLRLFTPKPYEL